MCHITKEAFKDEGIMIHTHSLTNTFTHMYIYIDR
jgi:hypothetical protein